MSEWPRGMRWWLGGLLAVAAAGAWLPVAHAEGDGPELLQADREFARATAERGSEGWASFFAENGTMLPYEGTPIAGRDAIRQAMVDLDDPQVSLNWTPERAEMAVPGVLGSTVGSFEYRTVDAGGGSTVLRGRYLTVWKKQADGTWKVVFDTGNPDGPPRPVE